MQSHSITKKVREFYEKNSFPGYEDIDNTQNLINKARSNLYIKLLDEQLPLSDSILEVGCGTGQLTNFLGLKNRRIIGIDLSQNSLKKARQFKKDNYISSVKFKHMNIFTPQFKPNSFDICLSNGVLHHTKNPRLAFKNMVALTKSDGLIILGLYNPFGRLFTNIKRIIFKYLGRIDILDYYLRDRNFPESKKKIWFKDQYQNPHESQHSVDEVLNWFKQENITYLNSIPNIIPLKGLKATTRLFKKNRVGSRIEHLLAQLIWIFTQAREGGIFILIGRKE